MVGLIYLIGTIVVIYMVAKYFIDEADRKAKNKRPKPANPIYNFDDRPIGPWAYFANAIYPRKFKSN